MTNETTAPVGASTIANDQQHSDNSGSFNQDMDDDIPW